MSSEFTVLVTKKEQQYLTAIIGQYTYEPQNNNLDINMQIILIARILIVIEVL